MPRTFKKILLTLISLANECFGIGHKTWPFLLNNYYCIQLSKQTAELVFRSCPILNQNFFHKFYVFVEWKEESIKTLKVN